MTITVIDNMEYGSDASINANYSGSIPRPTVTYSNGKTIVTFRGSGSFYTPNDLTVDVLVVAGGGCGGAAQYHGAGGGAGGVVYSSSFTCPSGVTLVSVGLGGNTHHVNGGNSSFGNITATGGGAGGDDGQYSGTSGGSGGGATKSGSIGQATPSGQGYPGGYGNGSSPYYGQGGGGGASQSGGNGTSTTGGNGGDGTSAYSDLLIAANAGVDIDGVRWIAGGGGGSTYSAGTPGIGGKGGGGNGSITNASPGTPNTGGGGGGSERNGSGVSGTGGSGIVIVSFNTSDYSFIDTTEGISLHSESSIVFSGSYSLKAIATSSSNPLQPVFKTIPSPINLTGHAYIIGKIRSNRTGSNIKIGFHDSGGTTTEVTPNITAADTWQTIQLDISAVSDANKDAIDQIIVTIVNADVDNTFYLDSLFAVTESDYNLQISKANTYAVLTEPEALSISKGNIYAVLQDTTAQYKDSNISKAVVYSVLAPLNGSNISKAVVYSVLAPLSGSNISKAVVYTVLAPPITVTKPFTFIF